MRSSFPKDEETLHSNFEEVCVCTDYWSAAKLNNELLRRFSQVVQLSLKTMGPPPGASRQHPKENAGFFSSIAFLWILPVLKNSAQLFRSLSEIYAPLKEDSSGLLGDNMEKAWCTEIENSRKKNTKPSLLKILFILHKKTLIVSALMIFVVEFVFRLLTPICLIEFIGYFDEKQRDSVSKELLIASTAGLILSPFITVFLNHYYHLIVFHVGMKLRVAISSLIYRKVLSLSRSTLSEISTGHIINLLSNDAGRFDYIGSFFFDIWIGPLQIFIVAYCLWNIVGPSCLIGIGTIVISIPLTVLLGKRISVMRLKTAEKTDSRVRIMNEIIVGIQVIKMYVWEKPFEKLVKLIRSKEVDVIQRVSLIRGVLYSLPMFHTRIAIYLTLITYVLTGNDITSSKTFVLTSFMNVLQLTVADYFPLGASQISEFLISLKRIEEFLLLNDENGKKKKIEKFHPLSEDYILKSAFPSEVPREIGISMKNVSAKWASENRTILKNISLDVQPGQLTAVIGTVGAGKTSLLYSILKEVDLVSGDVELSGKVSYASQEPWLFPASIKENIIFGEDYSEEKFKKILQACALDKDIDGFMYGASTLVGERGVTLSGGQKARISLARALYKEADIYLLDDPLSAVDTNVQKHLFDKCVKGLLKEKVVLLITHQLQYLKDVAQIVVLDNGTIKCIGNYEHLVECGLDFSIYLGKNNNTSEAGEMEPSKRPNSNDNEDLIVESTETIDNIEEISKKDLKLNIFWSYFREGGNICTLLSVFAIFFFAQVAASGGDYWTSYWVNLEDHIFTKNETHITDSILDVFSNYPSRNLCIYFFTFLVLSNVLLSLLRSSLFYSVCMKTSKKLHDNMFKAVSRSPMQFFNENPSGRILNRFSKDIGNIDEVLPSSMISCLQIFISAVGVFSVVPATNVWLLAPTFFVLSIFFILRKFYVASSCIIKRMEGIARSPVYTHLSTSLQGLSTVHALQASGLLNKEFDEHQDRHTATWYTFISAGRAIALWLDIVCAIYNALVTTSFLFLETSAFGGKVGLAITQTTALTSNLQWGMRQSAEVENHMTSVERILEYAKLEEESPLESVTGRRLPIDWPQQGKITFRNVSLRYNSTGPWVLNDLSFTILPSQKVGVVGRTGAGKSSLISALLRLFEVRGSLEIDALEVSSLGLWDLRSKISVIPQDPVLFTGSLRYNLDPFNEFSDDALWQALDEVELKGYIVSLKRGLQLEIHEGGSNLSIGQRQLISLARAILRNNRILLLDEPTANVDTRTDYFIQETIRRKFKKCTVITIAHRINSIMDSDVIMVMEFGKLVEFDHPFILLQNNSGYFYELVQQTGSFDDLFAVASERFSRRDV